MSTESERIVAATDIDRATGLPLSAVGCPALYGLSNFLAPRRQMPDVT